MNNNEDIKDNNNNSDSDDIRMFDDMEELINIDKIDEDNIDMDIDLKNISDLLDSERLNNHLRSINNDNTNKSNVNYKLIEQSNVLINEIDNDITRIHRYVSDIYSTKFPELTEMVVNPIEYVKCVKLIGNKKPEQIDEIQLRNILSIPHISMMINITATNENNKILSNNELNKVLNGCNIILSLNDNKNTILNYLYNKISNIAPNLNELIGSELTAKLIILSGSIKNLSLIPACNIQVLGQNKLNTINGYIIDINNNKNNKNVGILSQCDLIQDCPNHLKPKCLRLLANKVAQCSRIDCYQNNNNKNNLIGKLKREECLKKILKWQEPLPPKPIKPIAIPDNKPKKKRGGKRYRKMREKYKITETQRMQNRMAFNKKEETIIDGNGQIIGLGMLGSASDVAGKLRTIKSKTQNTILHKIHKRQLLKQKKLKLKAQKAGTITGLHTSVAFTSVQGIELSNPDNIFNNNNNNNKYFSNSDLFAKKPM